MSATNDNTPPRGLRGWWLNPPRSGLQVLIHPWVFRHLRRYGILHLAGGAVAAVAGIICLSYGVYGWAAFFLVIAALNLGGGAWYVSIARSGPARA
jgi:hypothetical protein